MRPEGASPSDLPDWLRVDASRRNPAAQLAARLYGQLKPGSWTLCKWPVLECSPSRHCNGEFPCRTSQARRLLIANGELPGYCGAEQRKMRLLSIAQMGNVGERPIYRESAPCRERRPANPERQSCCLDGTPSCTEIPGVVGIIPATSTNTAPVVLDANRPIQDTEAMGPRLLQARVFIYVEQSAFHLATSRAHLHERSPDGTATDCTPACRPQRF